MFELVSSYQPAGDQPKAIENILKAFQVWKNKLTLLGATGTWKTFTMANIIKELNKPTLVISHNKTLAAQLSTEFKYFFPKNAVHYFVSYFDYYQPEAYLPEKDMYIEKDSAINKEIEMYRLSTMASLLSRQDVIVVSSVSALYGLGTKEVFEKNMMFLEVWSSYDLKELKRKLLFMQYKAVQSKIESWMFDIRWEIVDIFSSVDKVIYRLYFNEDLLELIQMKDSLTYEDLWTLKKATIWPANQFLQDMSDLNNIYDQIKAEMEERVKELKSQWKELEANRLYKKVMYDIRMIKETWFTNGIENYSLYFDRRVAGQPPNTLFDYFPDDFLLIIDESHMSIPQLRAMPHGDRSRKINLIKHGFRLPSAIDHRPIDFPELEYIMWWNKVSDFNILPEENDEIDSIINQMLKPRKLDLSLIADKIKKNPKTLFVSATPSEYEINLSDEIFEQIIRPTGLLDPLSYVYPKDWDYDVLINSIENLLTKKPYLNKYMSSYDENVDLKELFLGS